MMPREKKGVVSKAKKLTDSINKIRISVKPYTGHKLLNSDTEAVMKPQKKR